MLAGTLNHVQSVSQSINPAVFAAGDNNINKGSEGTQSQKVTICYISVICGVDTPWPIPIKFDVPVALHDIIKISNFCNKMLTI